MGCCGSLSLRLKPRNRVFGAADNRSQKNERPTELTTRADRPCVSFVSAHTIRILHLTLYINGNQEKYK